MNGRRPDAIICTKEYPCGPGWDIPPISDVLRPVYGYGIPDRDYARKTLLGPVLGSKRVDSREIFGHSLVTRFGDLTSFLFPIKDERHPEQRHEWWVSSGAPDFEPVRNATSKDFAGDFVLIGFKKD